MDVQVWMDCWMNEPTDEWIDRWMNYGMLPTSGYFTSSSGVCECWTTREETGHLLVSAGQLDTRRLPGTVRGIAGRLQGNCNYTNYWIL